jgi:potassium efflux system protein
MTRNVHGVIELTFLNYLPVDAGARFATTTLCRYTVAVVGIIMAGRILGITWSSIQWLIAAMGIGLGFGLQEIFANFISGIILLFERPIRVGDMVTLGETTGVVTRIRMRATTITDMDQKEYIVPNKDLITGRLLNWTLSDTTNRIVITIGVAYGTDTQLACSLLMRAAREHRMILKDPPPVATFQEFGESSLKLVLRCFLPELEHRLETIHDLHTNINSLFRQAGIEIAFPQQDVHIRTIVPRRSRSMT